MGGGHLAGQRSRRLPVSPGLVPRGNIFMVLRSSTAHIISSVFRTPTFRKIAKGTLFFEMPLSPSNSRSCLHPHLVFSVSVHDGIMIAAEWAWRSLKDTQPSTCSKGSWKMSHVVLLLMKAPFLSQPLCPCCTPYTSPAGFLLHQA